MDSSSRSDSEDEETSAPFSDYENPNYRKLYATLSVTAMMGSKVESKADNDTDDDKEDEEDDADETTRLTNDGDSLPEGWEKHEDDNGPYYWHIPRFVIHEHESFYQRELFLIFNFNLYFYSIAEQFKGKCLLKLFLSEILYFTLMMMVWTNYGNKFVKRILWMKIFLVVMLFLLSILWVGWSSMNLP